MADDLGIGRGTLLGWHRHGLGLTDLGYLSVATTTATVAAYGILLESGDSLLQEQGDHLLLEFDVSYFVLLEDASYLLQESGSKVRTEG